jgi:hypothetical protein
MCLQNTRTEAHTYIEAVFHGFYQRAKPNITIMGPLHKNVRTCFTLAERTPRHQLPHGTPGAGKTQHKVDHVIMVGTTKHRIDYTLTSPMVQAWRHVWKKPGDAAALAAAQHRIRPYSKVLVNTNAVVIPAFEITGPPGPDAIWLIDTVALAIAQKSNHNSTDASSHAFNFVKKAMRTHLACSLLECRYRRAQTLVAYR